jgi:hypothetical protein
MKKSYHSIIVPVAEPTITLNREFVTANAGPGAEWDAIDLETSWVSAQFNRGSFSARRLGR